MMIIKRDFEEELGLSSLVSAAKGLTPYCVPDITESDLERINEQTQALDLAITTTVKDVTACHRVAKTPPSFEALLQQLKCYAILLITLFGKESPFFIVVIQMIKSLENYGDFARHNMFKQTIASIMWVLHAQSRHFTAGLMTTADTPGSLRDDFLHMITCIKTTQPVFNGDVPPTSTSLLPMSHPTHQLTTHPTRGSVMTHLEEIDQQKPKLSKCNTTTPSSRKQYNQFLTITKSSHASRYYAQQQDVKPTNCSLTPTFALSQPSLAHASKAVNMHILKLVMQRQIMHLPYSNQPRTTHPPSR